MSKPLLSICVPTYNRSKYLENCVDSIFKSIEGCFNEDIEVIVSNNASEDNTLDVLDKLKSKYKKLDYFTNEINIGFNYNLFKLTDEYSSGEYCWVIGDDDFIDRGTISFLINLLKKEDNVDFIGLNFRLMSFDDYLDTNFTFDFNKNKYKYKILEYDNLIGECSRVDNILCTFISSSIFKREKFSKYSKEIFSNDSWSGFHNTFPHSYIFANVFKGSRSIYVDTPMLTANIHEKSWDDKLPKLYLKIIPDLYFYYRTLGYDVNKYKVLNSNIAKSGGVVFFSYLGNKDVYINKFKFAKLYILNKSLYKGVLIGLCKFIFKR